MSKNQKSKNQLKKETLEREIKQLEENKADLESRKDAIWFKNIDSLQARQIEKLKFLELKLERGILALELTKKKVKERGTAGYYSCHHDIMEVITSVYSTCAHLSELKIIEDSIREILRKNAKKDSSSK